MVRCLSKGYPDGFRVVSWSTVRMIHTWSVAALKQEPMNLMSDGWRSLELGLAGLIR